MSEPTATPTTFVALIDACEERLTDETPWLVLADWCDDNDQVAFGFACRWCAKRGQRPQPPSKSVPFWQWHWENRLVRAFHNLPAPLKVTNMDQGRYGHTRYASLLDAMKALALGLAEIRDVSFIPGVDPVPV
jgi:hypothetical protein